MQPSQFGRQTADLMDLGQKIGNYQIHRQMRRQVKGLALRPALRPTVAASYAQPAASCRANRTARLPRHRTAAKGAAWNGIGHR